MRHRVFDHFFIVATVCALTLGSCAKRQELREPESLYEAPAYEDGVPEVTVPILKDAIFFESIKGVSSEVNVKVLKEEKKLGTFKGVFAFLSPDLMRLRVFDPFGSTILDLLQSGSMLQVLLPANNVLYEGEAPSIGIPKGLLYSIEEKRDGYILYGFLSPKDEKEGAKGSKPPPAGDEERAKPPDDSNNEEGSLTPFSLARKYFFSRSLHNTGVSVYTDGRMFVAIGLGRYSGSLPARMRLAFFNGFSVEMELTDAEADPDIPAEYFIPFAHEDRLVLPLRSLYEKLGP